MSVPGDGSLVGVGRAPLLQLLDVQEILLSADRALVGEEILDGQQVDPAATYLFAHCDGAVAGTGAMYVHDRTAYLFATSTEESFRRRGIQAALIEARLSLAQAAGCTLAFSRTAPGGASQRNLERLGFRAVYSKAAMRRRSA